MSNNIKIATIISYVTLIIGNIISLIYTPFMLTTLGKGEYGLFNLTNTIMSYIYLLDMGFGNAVIRYNSQYLANDNKDECEKLNGMFFCLYCSIAIVGAIISYFLYQNLDVLFVQGLESSEIMQFKVMFLIATINLIFAFPLNLFSGIIISYEKFIYTKTLALVRTILNPIVMICLLVMGYGAIGMLIGSTLFNVALGVINILYCFKKLKIKLQFKGFKIKLVKEIFKFSFFIFLSSLAYQIYWSSDQFILGMYIGSSAISIYAIGSQLNGYFTSFSNVINSMFLPRLTKITFENKGSSELMNLLVKVSRVQYFIAIFLLIGFLLIGKQFIFLWSGSEYELSYYIALLVMVPQLISIVQALFPTLLEAMNKHKVKSIIYFFVALFNLILTVILVKPFGAIGCAFATGLGMLLNALFNNLYYQYKLKLDMRYYWRQIISLISPTIAILLFGIILLLFLNPQTYLQIIIFIICFTILYSTIIWFFALNSNEKKIIFLITKKVLSISMDRLQLIRQFF